MGTLLRGLETLATRRPRSVIVVLLAMMVGMVALATSIEVEVDLTQLGSEDSEAVQTMDRVREEFGDPTAMVQVILDVGPGGDVLTTGGLAAVEAAREISLDALGPDVRRDEDGRPQIISLGAAVGGALADQGMDPAAVGDAQVGAIAVRVVGENPLMAGLVSDDVDLDEGSARATVLVLALDPELSESARTDAGERVQAALAGSNHAALADVEVTVFSNGLFVSGLLEAIRAEAPLLFALALLVVLFILALMYRSAFDVAVGFVGLLATVVYTFGIAALFGPAYLGWIGPQTQLAVIIPVLLVGLGIDYSVHLTARYREERITGASASESAGRALRTVGAALVLATAATAVGFASIATAPLQMVADFGFVIAVGVVWAFLIMGLLVPAARVLRDRREVAQRPAAVRELRLAPLMRAPIWLARRAPVVGLSVATVIVGVSLVAATGLEVEFDRDDFIPEGSQIEAVLAHQEELFGGGVTESTFVVIDGDFADGEVADAVWDAQRRVGRIAGVRRVGGDPQVISVLSMAATALDSAGGRLAGGIPGGDDLRPLYARLRQGIGAQRMEQFLAPDAQSGVVQIRTTTGDGGAERMQREVEEAFVPVERAGATVTVTSEPIIIAEMSDELSRFQARAIGMTLVIVLVLLTAYYTLAHRRWLFGPIAMIPAVISAALILGMMSLLGISFNVLTATLTAIAIGIGVPYGVHVVNRFAEDLEGSSVDDAVSRTLHGTGAALTGSALTTLGAFVVLSFSGLPPIRSLGLLGGAGIAFALLGAVLVEPGALVLWARRRSRTPA